MIDVDGVTVTFRAGPTDVVLCVGYSGDEQCAADPDASLHAPPVAASVDAVVGGEWIIAGVFELEGAGYRPVIDDDEYGYDGYGGHSGYDDQAGYGNQPGYGNQAGYDDRGYGQQQGYDEHAGYDEPGGHDDGYGQQLAYP